MQEPRQMEVKVKSCDLCKKGVAKYVCPRCGLSYCSLPCYRSGPHLTCAESFYKDCVKGELERMRSEPGDVKDMTATLQRFHDQQEHQEDYGDEDDPHDLLDSDDEEPLAQRLQGIDLEDADAVWNNLTPEERSEFKQFVTSVKIEEVVEEWTPWWWEEPETPKLVEDVSQEVEVKVKRKGDDEKGQGQPTILENIPAMSSLTRVKPNDVVTRGLANVLGSYVWVCRLYNGDFQSYPNSPEVVAALVSLSSFLSKDAVFASFEHSLTDVSLNACQIPELFDGGPALQSNLSKDVFRIMQGPSGGGGSTENKSLTLSALSDSYRLVDKVIKSQKKKSMPTASDPQAQLPAQQGEESFEKIFPSGSGGCAGTSGSGASSSSVILIEPQLLRKTRRKLHYLLAFANEFPILPPLPKFL